MTQTQTDEEARAEELRLLRRHETDFAYYASRCLKIRTKAGDVVPFRLNQSQLHLHKRLEKQLKDKGKVRAIVLKGRQVGISTYIAGRFYWRTTHNFGKRAFVLTHLDAASDNIFGLTRRFHENCPVLLRPSTKASNAKELSFGDLDSGFKIATAGSAEVGRSETIQYMHGSEVAFWPNAQKHAAGVQQAIANVAGTEVIFESTAKGIGNSFHTLWKAAERGESEYEASFIPWFFHVEYAAPFSHDWQAPTAFREYRTAYGLTAEQMHWAWLKNRELVNNAGGGSHDQFCWQFKQEYPANADEAFQTGGIGSFIPAEAIVKARKGIATPYGPIILGVDPAAGGSDKTGIVDRQGRRLGGNICKRIDITDLMEQAAYIQREAVKPLMPLGLKKVIVDVTGLGRGLYDRLRELLGDDLVEGVSFGAKAYEAERYANRRAEIWDRLREWMNDPAGVQIPDSDELHGDLAAITAEGTVSGGTHFNSSGQLVLESKDHIRTRLSFSPDLGDAAALTFAVDLSTASAPVDPWSSPPPTPGGWLAA